MRRKKRLRSDSETLEARWRVFSKKNYLQKKSFKNMDSILSSLMFDNKNNLVIFSVQPKRNWSENFLFQKPWNEKWYQTQMDKASGLRKDFDSSFHAQGQKSEKNEITFPAFYKGKRESFCFS